MQKIAFMDIEAARNSNALHSIGWLIGDDTLEIKNLETIKQKIIEHEVKYICGHNFVDFDNEKLKEKGFDTLSYGIKIIDTLYLSLLLRIQFRQHKLEKSYKNDEEIFNNPVEDCKETRKLFETLEKRFDNLNEDLKQIFIYLLKDSEYFQGFFHYKNCTQESNFDIYQRISQFTEAPKDLLHKYISESPIELAFALSYAGIKNDFAQALPLMILKKFPKITKDKIIQNLSFDSKSVDIESFAKEEFGIGEFREFDRIKVQSENLFEEKNSQEYEEKISQKDIVEAALEDKSLLTILPTGGGKTFTFQLPALLKAKAYKGLSIVISPLQALMKNHTEGFKKKNQNFTIVALSGYLNPIERMEVIREVREGIADVLYLAPEALRTMSNLKLLQNRLIERFIIDEAHCFSTWGHDLRCDYWFIAKFIKELEKSEHQPKIPVSCFTATAKKEVLSDIKDYLKEKLELDLVEFIAKNERKNLHYKAFEIKIDDEKESKNTKKKLERNKFNKLIEILLDENKERKKPTIIYIPQNAKACAELAKELKDNEKIAELDLKIEPFYADIDKEIEKGVREGRGKDEILDGFLNNEIDIIIATTAFGMGIDKPDIQVVIHYGQSDSIESYLQESGRGARDINLNANCYVLYYEEEFQALFSSIVRNRLDSGMMEKIVSSLKYEAKAKKYKEEFNINPNKIMKQLESLDGKISVDRTMINTALLELEKFEIIERDFNKNKLFATSVEAREKGMEGVHKTLEKTELIENKLKSNGIRIDDKIVQRYKNYIILIMQNIIKRSVQNSRVSTDELADLTGVNDKEIFVTLEIMRELKLIAFENDISARVAKDEIEEEFDEFFELEKKIFEIIKEEIKTRSVMSLKDINKSLENHLKKSNKAKKKENRIDLIKDIIRSWKTLSDFKKKFLYIHFRRNKHIEILKNLEDESQGQNEIEISKLEQKSKVETTKLDEEDMKTLDNIISKRKKICNIIIEYLLKKAHDKIHDEGEIEFSSFKLKEYVDDKLKLHGEKTLRIESFHYCLVYLNDLLNNFKILRGRLIYYQEYKIKQMPYKIRKKEDEGDKNKKAQEKEKQYELSHKKPYLKGFYEQSLGRYYENKIISLNLLIFFLDKLSKGKEQEAFWIVRAYFTLEKDEFIKKYELAEEGLKEATTKSQRLKIKSKTLSKTQKEIIESKAYSILVLAGPGSGKTKTLVHKIASLVTIEAHKSEYFLMLAHSRSAVSEFKERLYDLIGNAVYDMYIMTFHAFALELLGSRINQDDKKEEQEFEEVIERACKALEEETITLRYIQTLVLDEFQDVNEMFYRFIKLIYKNMSVNKIIAVGDDDQCINNFGKFRADVKFIQEFKKDFIDAKDEANEESEEEESREDTTDKEKSNPKKRRQKRKEGETYELLENYRSKENIVTLANLFRKKIPNPLKQNEIKAVSDKKVIEQKKGFVKITQYSANSSILENIVNEVSKELEKLKESENIAILLRSNEEVLGAFSVLNERGIKASYILKKEGFRLGNLVELRDFLEFLRNNDFDEAQKLAKEKYDKSSNFNLFCEAVERFKKEYEGKFEEYSKETIAGYFEAYLKEIEFDEFESTKSKVIVSTMHKAKGKEFDSVFVCIDENFISKEYEYDIRLLYVALTRAKTALHIHSKNTYINEIFNEPSFASFDKVSFNESSQNKLQKIFFMMNLGDINLGFNPSQNNIKQLKPLAGDKVEIKKDKYGNFDIYKDNKILARLAKPTQDKLSQKILDKIKQGYTLDKEAQIEYIVRWHNQEGKEFDEVLCKISMTKQI
ncbi:MAG: AAA family ATPase [Helicobacter sp.]|nr:AAA family ATPase [Helicobacter sp.]